VVKPLAPADLKGTVTEASSGCCYCYYRLHCDRFHRGCGNETGVGAHAELLKEQKGKSPAESKDQMIEREGRRWRKGKKHK